MFQNAKNGDLHFIMDNQTVAISSIGSALTPTDIVTKPVSNYGTTNLIVARTSLQADRLIGASTIAPDKNKKDQFSQLVIEYRERLLRMHETYDYLWGELIRCDKEFNNSNLPIRLPQILNLNSKVEGFLLDGKKALSEIAKLFNLFFNYQNSGHNYDSHLTWARQHFSKESIIVNILEDNTTGDRWIYNLCDLRNRVEHPKENYSITIQNLELDPNTKKMIPPRWSTENHPESSLLDDMGIFINNTLVLSEDLVAGCIAETLTVPNFFCVAPISPDQIDPKLPMRWGVFSKRPMPEGPVKQ